VLDHACQGVRRRRDVASDHSRGRSDIRSLHASSFRALAAPALDASQVAAYVDWIYSPDYTDVLITQDLLTAYYEHHLVGTAGWIPADDAGVSARISAVYVAPLFARLGIGRRLLAAAEARAEMAGFRSFSARVFPKAFGFFESMGYARSSQGALSIGTDNGIPVTFMRKAAPRPTDVDAEVRALRTLDVSAVAFTPRGN
jgi:GNAT superfamily N-acetyltransferase